jgi:uncharacterized membrane protein YjjP (DUF1212 family)
VTPRTKTRVLSLLLTVASLFLGYTLHRLNGGRDPVVWVVFTVGLLGVLLSVLRNARGG